MDANLHIALLILALVASLAALGGETCNQYGHRWYRRLTWRGHVVALCLIFTFVLGVRKSFADDAYAISTQAAQHALRDEVSTRTKEVVTLGETVSRLKRELQAAIRSNGEGLERIAWTTNLDLSGEQKVVVRVHDQAVQARGTDIVELFVRRDAAKSQITSPADLTLRHSTDLYPLSFSSDGRARVLLSGGDTIPDSVCILNPSGSHTRLTVRLLSFYSDELLELAREAYSDPGIVTRSAVNRLIEKTISIRGGKNIDQISVGSVQHGGKGGHQLASFTVPKDGIEEVVVYMNGQRNTVRGVKFYGNGGGLLGSALGSAVSRKDTVTKRIGGSGLVVTSLSFVTRHRIDDISGTTMARKP